MKDVAYQIALSTHVDQTPADSWFPPAHSRSLAQTLELEFVKLLRSDLFQEVYS